MEGTNQEESADESTDFSGKETEGLAMEEEAETARGKGGSAICGRRRRRYQ